MAEDTDFAALYRELGLDPGCTLAELRNAYRRRVARLHPDQGGDAQDTGRLQRLNRLYRAAIDFHRSHGRLPGAASVGSGPLRHADAAAARADARAAAADAPADSTAGDEGPTPDALAKIAGFDHAVERPDAFGAARMATTERLWDEPASETSAAGFGRLSRYFVAAAVLCIVALGWRVVDGDAGGPQGDTEAAQSASLWTSGPGKAAHIAPGMGKDIVQEIQGEPIVRHDAHRDMRWDYGPSWVEFRCGKVVDWYSSPLHPLRVSSARAPASPAGDGRDSACAP